jgi:hypothetical protein
MLNKAKLSQILRRAEFKASKQTTTAVRGWYNYSRGYQVELFDENGTCYVSHRGGDSLAAVEQYASALIALGFNVHFAHAEDDTRHGHMLVVSEYPVEA